MDNTLTPAHNALPIESSFAFVDKCRKLGMDFYIISNNHSERVKKVADPLSVGYYYSTQKPFGRRLLKFLEMKNIDATRCVVIGDQLLTDVFYANRLGIRSILVEPISDKDLLITFINRRIDKMIRHNLRKKDRLKQL